MGHLFGCTKAVAFLLIIALPSHAQVHYNEQQKIDHLICFISKLNDAVFIRNDTEHTAKAASEHLQLKRKKAGNRIKSADDFITHIASKSSISNKPYLIRMSNGRTIECEFVLRAELKRLQSGTVPLCTE